MKRIIFSGDFHNIFAEEELYMAVTGPGTVQAAVAFLSPGIEIKNIRSMHYEEISIYIYCMSRYFYEIKRYKKGCVDNSTFHLKNKLI